MEGAPHRVRCGAPAVRPPRGGGAGSGRADALRLAAEGDREGQLLGAAHQRELQRAVLGKRVEDLVELVGVAHLAVAGTDDQVADADPGAAGRATVLDGPDQQPVTLGQADGVAHAPRDAGVGDADAQPWPGGRLAPGERVEPPAQLGVGGDGQVEAVAEAVGVDAEQAALRVDHRPARRAPAERRGVLQAAGDAAAARPAEGAVHGGDEADRDAPAAAGAGQREHGGGWASPVSTETTARSASRSTPSTRPVAARPSAKTTVTSSPRRLWALVATRPSARTMPEPRPGPRPMPTTAPPACSATREMACSSSSSALMDGCSSRELLRELLLNCKLLVTSD